MLLLKVTHSEILFYFYSNCYTDNIICNEKRKCAKQMHFHEWLD